MNREDRANEEEEQGPSIKAAAEIAPRPADYSDKRVSDELVLLARLTYHASPLPSPKPKQKAAAAAENPPVPLFEGGAR